MTADDLPSIDLYNVTGHVENVLTAIHIGEVNIADMNMTRMSETDTMYSMIDVGDILYDGTVDSIYCLSRDHNVICDAYVGGDDPRT